MAHPDPTPLSIDPKDIEWTPGEEDERGLLTVSLLGTLHHLVFLPVKRTRTQRQRGCTRRAEEDLRALQRLYVGAYQAVQLPGRPDDYVVYLHPYGA